MANPIGREQVVAALKAARADQGGVSDALGGFGWEQHAPPYVEAAWRAVDMGDFITALERWLATFPADGSARRASTLVPCHCTATPTDSCEWCLGAKVVPPRVFHVAAREHAKGLSSRAIVDHIAGRGANTGEVPHDLGDLRRCLELLEAAPLIAKRFDVMRYRSKTWAKLVAVWAEMKAEMSKDTPAGNKRASELLETAVYGRPS